MLNRKELDQLVRAICLASGYNLNGSVYIAVKNVFHILKGYTEGEFTFQEKEGGWTWEMGPSNVEPESNEALLKRISELEKRIDALKVITPDKVHNLIMESEDDK